MNNNVWKLLNNQYNKELATAALMFEYSARIDEYGMDHFSSLLYEWAKEELEHAQTIEKYLRKRQAWIRTNELMVPKVVDSNEPLQILEAISEYQRNVSAAVNEIAEVAFMNKDFATYNFIEYFIEDQIAEEKKCADLLNAFKMSEDLLVIDKKIEEIKNEHYSKSE
ncbi:ferritin-like domain-containing protein [Mycoplasma bradburyae]|uniref:Ferritin n=1 Tax=Mycoplasma bradburyae TaxID=2963128 RepID=A0AAW6HS73_9MOLU|nr:ferritin-like domain-containing protein [Mycoplasma bradburyae]MDC4163229.1 ferritin [Mycoplasma bradburyae]MDC4181843.1 ferritin [Mycoplasma bradburyae]MDC4182544.1 ferritin [Mycoplasma bradburyae]MDC4183220.1 ferritin [Mycoplasma bradburyae]MDC4184026.1 ferritin [Mycoplasma bradburyae]